MVYANLEQAFEIVKDIQEANTHTYCIYERLGSGCLNQDMALTIQQRQEPFILMSCLIIS